jgi:hypothetical protein
MKTRMSVRLFDHSVEFAREYAARHGIPLSRVVEVALWRLKEKPTEPTFAEKWHGVFYRIKDPEANRRRYLEKKYGPIPKGAKLRTDF